MKRYFVLILSILLPYLTYSQVDTVLPGLIYGITKQSEKMYESQLAAMGLETTGHVLYEHEVEQTKNFQKQFDNYLNSFRSTIAYAAQAYGFYYEVRKLTDNIGRLNKEIGDSPANAVAVALHNKRNDIYFEIITSCMGVINTIREVCIDKKMKESERIELLFSVRPQLQNLNDKLQKLVNLVKYTTLAQVWHGIEGKAFDHRDGKADIIEESLEDWLDSGKSVKVK